MKLLLQWKTSAGTFYIGQSADGRFHPIFDDESLGSYTQIGHAVDDLVNDATFSVLHPETSDLLDTSELDIPEDPREWQQTRYSS